MTKDCNRSTTPLRTLWLTQKDGSQRKREALPEFGVELISRSGIHSVEFKLLKALAQLRERLPKGGCLFAGGRTGAAPMVVATSCSERSVGCWVYDSYHLKSVVRSLETNSLLSHVDVRCEANLFAPQGNPLGCIGLMVTAGGVAGELAVDCLEQAVRLLPVGGLVMLATDLPVAPLLKQMRGLLAKCDCRDGVMWGWKTQEPKRNRSFEAHFTASLPGHESIELVTIPGVFCHRRPDMGGLALAEVVAERLSGGEHLVDMGCGCGMVGLLLGKAVRDLSCTFIDSNARALAMTKRNAEACGLAQNEFILSAEGWQGVADAFVGNPPYFGDWRIAELFIETARNTLRVGGHAWFVAKTSEKLRELASKHLVVTNEVSRRGYKVIECTKE